VGPGAGLDESRKCRPHRNSIPGPSSPKRVAIPVELSRPTTTTAAATTTISIIIIIYNNKTSTKYTKLSETNIQTHVRVTAGYEV